jgi:hypothetical protein
MASKTRAKSSTTAPKADTSGDGIPDFYDQAMPRALDARPDRFDFRDLAYLPPLRSLPPVFPTDAQIRQLLPSYVKAGLILNQGQEGACTGFGLAGVANYLFWRRHLENGGKGSIASVSARMFYSLAKHYDEWPGQDYEGSSCRGALKGWHKHGVCADALWPYPLDKKGKPKFVRPGKGWAADATRRPLGVYFRVNKASVVDVQAAINEIGAVYVSATVHDGWDTLMNDKRQPAPKSHADLQVIAPVKDPSQNGGHAFALVGYNDRGFVVQNSWGPIWGASGFGVLPYDDFAVNVTDCWALALGVPEDLQSLRRANRARRDEGFRASRALGELVGRAANPANPSDDPWPFDHAFNFPAYQPWSTGEAYRHTLVSGNDGQMMVTDFTRDRGDVAGQAREICVERPLAWLKARKLKTLKLALYCHGGLNDEQASIQRIRVLGPNFDANDIYPLFITWKTGPGETLFDMLQDWSRRISGGKADRGLAEVLSDAKDRAIEATGRVLGRGIWSEMRENAERGGQDGHVLQQAASQLRALRDAVHQAGCAFELHLVGHSAGSILIGHLLDQLGGKDKLPAQSCELWAAACSVDFANQHYLKAAASGVLPLERLRLAMLSDANERADGLPSPKTAVYGKSLLYLVSRALDDVRKQPLLGMERSLAKAFAKDDDQWDTGRLAGVQAWQKAFGVLDGGHPRCRVISLPQIVTTRAQDQTPATHGSFDNNMELIGALLARIRGQDLVAPLEWLDY